MKYRNLGKSGLKVSELGLGCNNFGERIDEHNTALIVNYAIDQGINFFDTADFYGRGKSEEFLGKALKGKREQIILATKFGSKISNGINDGGGSRSYIMRAIDASLKRLQTDYIDLYQMHWPDPQTPVDETLRALDDLVKDGKIRYFGCSNMAAWRICNALWTSRTNNLASFITTQMEYSLLYRTVEQQIVPCVQNFGIGLIPWGPLASGLLTGKYQQGKSAPAGSRLAARPDLQAILNDKNFEILSKLQIFAAEHGHSILELAIGWLLSHPWLPSVINGATSVEQLTTNITACNWVLSAEEKSEVDEISAPAKSQTGLRPVT